MSRAERKTAPHKLAAVREHQAALIDAGLCVASCGREARVVWHRWSVHSSSSMASPRSASCAPVRFGQAVQAPPA